MASQADKQRQNSSVAAREVLQRTDQDSLTKNSNNTWKVAKHKQSYGKILEKTRNKTYIGKGRWRVPACVNHL
jgi:hypothetical protein